MTPSISLNELETAILREATQEEYPADSSISNTDLVETGRRGKIRVYFGSIAKCIKNVCLQNYPAEKIANTISSAKDDRYKDAILPTPENKENCPFSGMEALQLNSSFLPVLLMDIQGDILSDPSLHEKAGDMAQKQNEEAYSDYISPVQKSEKAKSKSPARKKSSKGVSKNTLMELLNSDMNIRNTRAFLLTLPQYKPQDIALMTDQQVTDAFLENYRCMTLAGGTLILSAADFAQLIDFMTGLEIHFRESE